ncbi:MAG: arginase, partial [Halobacteriaceae archaeon]
MRRQIQIIGVPADFGANRRGVDMGPSAIRYAGLGDELTQAGNETTDAGDLLVPRAEETEPETDSVEGKAKFLPQVEGICSRLAEEVAEAIDNDLFPLVLGGDHSIAIGTINGASQATDIGAIWFDAHGDFNTPETSPSGNVHGMPLAAVTGQGIFAGMEWANATNLPEGNVVIVGLRNVDEEERNALKQSSISVFTMSDIDERGMKSVVEDAIDIATHGVDGIHVSLDLDWVDPNDAPGVGTPVRGGVTYREAHT